LNYQQILGIKPNASPEEIKKAYRRLAKRYHPDVNPNNPNAAAKFIVVREAYEYALAEKIGGVRPKTQWSAEQSTTDPVARKRNEEINDIYRFISNLEQLCLRTVHKEEDRKMRALVDHYYKRAWTKELLRKINEYATYKQKFRIIDLSRYLFKMVSIERANYVRRFLYAIAGENLDLQTAVTGMPASRPRSDGAIDNDGCAMIFLIFIACTFCYFLYIGGAPQVIPLVGIVGLFGLYQMNQLRKGK